MKYEEFIKAKILQAPAIGFDFHLEKINPGAGHCAAASRDKSMPSLFDFIELEQQESAA